MRALAVFGRIVLNHLPLTVFTACASLRAQEADRWLAAYLVGGSVALGHLCFLVSRRKEADRVAVAVDAYLIFGCLAVFFEFTPGLAALNRAREGGLMLSIALVGGGSIFFTKGGFIGCAAAGTRAVRKYSLALLFGAFVCCAVSFLFKGKLFVSAVVPVIFLVLGGAVFRRLALWQRHGG